MLKLAVKATRGPIEELPMQRMKFETGSTLLHVAAQALVLTPTEAEEQIIRIVGFCSLDEKNPVKLGTADLHEETVDSMIADGIRAVQFSLQMTEKRTCELDGAGKGELSRSRLRRGSASSWAGVSDGGGSITGSGGRRRRGGRRGRRRGGRR